MGRSITAYRGNKTDALRRAGRLCIVEGKSGLRCLNKGSVRLIENVTDYDFKGNVTGKSTDIVTVYCPRHFRKLCHNILAWEKSGVAVVDREREIVTITVEGLNYKQVQVYHFNTVEEF